MLPGRAAIAAPLDRPREAGPVDALGDGKARRPQWVSDQGGRVVGVDDSSRIHQGIVDHLHLESRGRRHEDDARGHRRGGERKRQASCRPQRQESRDDCGGRRVDGEQPGRAAIGSRRDPVHGRGEPDDEVEVVRAPPEAVRKGLPVVVRHRERNEQLGRDHAEGDRDRPVGRRAGNQDVGQRERQVAVDQQRAHVDEDERPREQADEAVHVLERETQPA